MKLDAWAGALLWWSCQKPVAHNCGLLNHPNSFPRGWSSLMQILMQIHCFTPSVILNVMATQVHLLTQLLLSLTSSVKSSLFAHVHSSPFSLAPRLHWGHSRSSHYINNGWTFFGQTSYILATLFLWRSLGNIALVPKVVLEEQNFKDEFSELVLVPEF